MRPQTLAIPAILAMLATLPPRLHAQSTAASADSAIAWVRRAADRLGGLDALRGVATIRSRYQTLWYRPSWAPTASGLVPFGSAEENIDVRDYRIPVWRMERRFGTDPGPPAIVNIVRDSVAATTTRLGTGPQNAAYVDERTELFLIAPERLLTRLADEPARFQLRAARDTTIEGRTHHVVTATVDGIPARLFISRAGYLRGMQYRAAQPLDFGLAGLGTMDVTVYY